MGHRQMQKQDKSVPPLAMNSTIMILYWGSYFSFYIHQYYKVTSHTYRSWLFGLEELCRNSLLWNDIDNSSPTRIHVSITSCCYYLVQFELELLFVHTFPVVCLTNCEQLLTTCACAFESLYHALSADWIVWSEDWNSVLETCHDWLYYPSSESLLIFVYLFSKRE